MLTPRDYPMSVQQQFGLSIGEIPDSASIFDANPASGNQPITPMGPENVLMMLRAQFPFLPIIPLGKGSSIVCTANTQAYDLVVPDDTSLVRFSATAPFWLSIDGDAFPLPTASAGVPKGEQSSSRAIYNPVEIWFFVGSRKTFSVFSPTAGAIVNALCLQPTKLPRY